MKKIIGFLCFACFFMLIGYFRGQKEKVVTFLEKYGCWNVEWCNTAKDFLQKEIDKNTDPQDLVNETAKKTEKVTTQEKETKVKKEEKSEYDFSLVNPNGKYYDFVVKYFQLEKDPEEWKTFQKLPKKFFDFERADDAMFTDEEEILLFENETTFGNWKLGENYKISNEKLGLAFEDCGMFAGDYFCSYIDQADYQVSLNSFWYGIWYVDYDTSIKFDVPQQITFFGEDYVLDLGTKNTEHGTAREEREYTYSYEIHGGDSFFYNFTSQKEAEGLVTAYIKETGIIRPVYGITFEKYPGMLFKYVHKMAKSEVIEKNDYTIDGKQYTDEHGHALISLLVLVPDSLNILTDDDGTITDSELLKGLIHNLSIVNIDDGEEKNIPSQYQSLLSKISDLMFNMGVHKGGSYIYSAYGKKYDLYDLWDYYTDQKNEEGGRYRDRATKPLFVLKTSKVPGYRILSVADDIELCMGSIQAYGCW